jgi:hypothetical protein
MGEGANLGYGKKKRRGEGRSLLEYHVRLRGCAPYTCYAAITIIFTPATVKNAKWLRLCGLVNGKGWQE